VKRAASSQRSAVGLRLEPAEADVLAADAQAFARGLSDPTVAARYLRLASAAAEGVVPGELVPAVEAMLELVFEKGRPSNRAVLQSLFGKTPRGKQRSAAARDVNRALKTLRGQTIEQLRLSAGPSGQSLVIETDKVRLMLELDSSGARVASLETG
jgi:hypothetical protein